MFPSTVQHQTHKGTFVRLRVAHGGKERSFKFYMQVIVTLNYYSVQIQTALNLLHLYILL